MNSSDKKTKFVLKNNMTRFKFYTNITIYTDYFKVAGKTFFKKKN